MHSQAPRAPISISSLTKVASEGQLSNACMTGLSYTCTMYYFRTLVFWSKVCESCEFLHVSQKRGECTVSYAILNVCPLPAMRKKYNTLIFENLVSRRGSRNFSKGGGVRRKILKEKCLLIHVSTRVHIKLDKHATLILFFLFQRIVF